MEKRVTTPYAWLAVVGQKLFRIRLLVGLSVVFAGLEWISPKPFLGGQYRILHVCALLVIAAGLAVRAWGAGSAGIHTRSGDIEAPCLATGGAYAFVRNPIYIGSLCIGLGMSMLISDPRAFLFAAAAFGILYFTIVPAEEAFLSQRFGARYTEYCNAVPRLIPRFTPWHGQTRTRFHWQAIRGECIILLVLILIYAALWFEEYLDKLGVA